MSRIGNQPVEYGQDVTVGITPGAVTVTGPKGTVVVAVPEGVSVMSDQGSMMVQRSGNAKPIRASHGLVRAELRNAVVGVTSGWTRDLELSGVGYRVTLNGTSLVLTVGFSHPVTIEPKPGTVFSIVEGKIRITGISKGVVGQLAAIVRDVKKPEPYKGKGIKYVGERIRKKAGKSAKAIGGSPGAK